MKIGEYINYIKQADSSKGLLLKLADTAMTNPALRTPANLPFSNNISAAAAFMGIPQPPAAPGPYAPQKPSGGVTFTRRAPAANRALPPLPPPVAPPQPSAAPIATAPRTNAASTPAPTPASTTTAASRGTGSAVGKWLNRVGIGLSFVEPFVEPSVYSDYVQDAQEQAQQVQAADGVLPNLRGNIGGTVSHALRNIPRIGLDSVPFVVPYAGPAAMLGGMAQWGYNKITGTEPTHTYLPVQDPWYQVARSRDVQSNPAYLDPRIAARHRDRHYGSNYTSDTIGQIANPFLNIADQFTPINPIVNGAKWLIWGDNAEPFSVRDSALRNFASFKNWMNGDNSSQFRMRQDDQWRPTTQVDYPALFGDDWYSHSRSIDELKGRRELPAVYDSKDAWIQDLSKRALSNGYTPKEIAEGAFLFGDTRYRDSDKLLMMARKGITPSWLVQHRERPKPMDISGGITGLEQERAYEQNLRDQANYDLFNELEPLLAARREGGILVSDEDLYDGEIPKSEQDSYEVDDPNRFLDLYDKVNRFDLDERNAPDFGFGIYDADGVLVDKDIEGFNAWKQAHGADWEARQISKLPVDERLVYLAKNPAAAQTFVNKYYTNDEAKNLIYARVDDIRKAWADRQNAASGAASGEPTPVSTSAPTDPGTVAVEPMPAIEENIVGDPVAPVSVPSAATTGTTTSAPLDEMVFPDVGDLGPSEPVGTVAPAAEPAPLSPLEEAALKRRQGSIFF